MVSVPFRVHAKKPNPSTTKKYGQSNGGTNIKLRTNRRVTRHAFLRALLLLLLVTIFARRPHFSPLVKYEGKQSCVLKTFQSTSNRIPAPENYRNPGISKDPRFRENAPAIPRIYRPYPVYNCKEWNELHSVPFSPFEGPRGSLLNESLDDQVGAYVGIRQDHPAAMLGSYDAVGLDGALSFDRYTRYGAYGFGENETSDTNWMKPTTVDWDQVNWGQLQDRYYERNAGRFSQVWKAAFDSDSEPHTAVLIRTYTGRNYTKNDVHVIRSIVTELSLQSGGEYKVILFLHVRNSNIPIEQQDVSPQAASYCPDLDRSVTDVHHSQWLSVQRFALNHPEFDFIWNWEIDTRFSGHHYELIDRTAQFARQQPRRGLWERNARFYIPEVHGDHAISFQAYVQDHEDEAVWGPAPFDLREPFQPFGSAPLTQHAHEDNYDWEVGEDADLITFLPIFHPIGTKWVTRNEVWGYPTNTPRRASLITHYRLSRALLLAMHEENLAGRHMGSELFPASTALLHGLKAVSVPHPIYSDIDLPARTVDRWFNSGVNGRSGSTADSPFSAGREIRFRDVSWSCRANLPSRLYWTFLGWDRDGIGDVSPDSDSAECISDAELSVEATINLV
ncbi:hypothetical protein BO94DRAFT_559611 [Aspergillus sclerotioniger CBS 115572]|uniref:Uncharacterized protein n=1 Tax=Aspergillus sclerotioniger CBS 115572 TaxID=1450535 RepID=A0A317VNX7_9EURO|nr:hypothetical protein BO94DRAFT_559611 [Aspergillus sclerotioniger CBS 115572]PWY75299.1 hypothetical protein BO94DRAFT_559611 [Aspergillus sclerotioniger CBS 115572]